MAKRDHTSLTMSVPSEKPFFIEIEGLRTTYEQYEYDLLKGTGWLWIWLSEPDKVSFDQMYYHGLAEFFTEIAMSYAYYLALRKAGLSSSKQLLFHMNNIILRIAACWDRIGFALNELLRLGLDRKSIYFCDLVDAALDGQKVRSSIQKKIKRMKKRFDKGGDIREWRQVYLHRHGEHFEVEQEGSIVYEGFSTTNSDREGILANLETTVKPSFEKLKEAMEICSEIFFP